NLFVSTLDGTIAEYTTAGAPVNTALVTGLNAPRQLATDGTNLFVTLLNDGAIGEYTTSGATVNAALVTGLYAPEGIAVLGDDLFVADTFNNRVGEYTTSGATINASLITAGQGLASPRGIAVVPEPAAFALASAGLLGLLPFVRRRIIE